MMLVVIKLWGYYNRHSQNIYWQTVYFQTVLSPEYTNRTVLYQPVSKGDILDIDVVFQSTSPWVEKWWDKLVAIAP